MMVTYDVIWWLLTMWYDGYLRCDMMVTYNVIWWLLTMWYDGYLQCDMMVTYDEISFSYKDIMQSFSSFTSRYSTKPSLRKSSKLRNPWVSSWMCFVVTRGLHLFTMIYGLKIQMFVKWKLTFLQQTSLTFFFCSAAYVINKWYPVEPDRGLSYNPTQTSIMKQLCGSECLIQIIV